jgi:hypothetical protein
VFSIDSIVAIGTVNNPSCNDISKSPKIEQEFGISSPSRLPHGITPLNDTSSTLKDDLNNTLKYSEVESSTPVRGRLSHVPDSLALSVIDPDQSSIEVGQVLLRISISLLFK